MSAIDRAGAGKKTRSGSSVRILLLNQTFYPDVVSTAQHLSDLALGLVARGHEVTVVASRRGYDAPQCRFERNEVWRGVRIVRVGSTGFGKGARWRRAADFSSFLLACAARVMRLPRQDVIVALTSPPLIGSLGAHLARMHRSRFVYWVMDLNPDEAIAAGWLRRGSVVARLLEKLSRLTFERADQVVALDRFMQERIVFKGVSREKVVVIPPWSHDAEVGWNEAGRARFRKLHGLGDKFVVMHSGNHSPCHPLDTLLAAAERLRSDERVSFCFVGGGSEFQKVEHWTQRTAQRNVLCLPYQSLGDLSASLSAADLHVVVMGERFVGLVHPCKIYNALRIGVPILYIGPEASHITELANESCGRIYSARHGQVGQIVEAVKRAREGGTRLEGRGLVAMNSRFSRETLLPRLVCEVVGPSEMRPGAEDKDDGLASAHASWTTGRPG